jgi:hypothetical protein
VPVSQPAPVRLIQCLSHALYLRSVRLVCAELEVVARAQFPEARLYKLPLRCPPATSYRFSLFHFGFSSTPIDRPRFSLRSLKYSRNAATSSSVKGSIEHNVMSSMVI